MLLFPRCDSPYSARQSDWHDQVQKVFAALLGLEHTGPQRADQPEAERVAGDGLDPVTQELSVEADLERLAGEGDRQRLLGLADVLSPGRHRQLALGEAKAERRVALRHHRDAADDVEDLVTRQRHLVVEALRDQLPVVRELPVDTPRRQPDAVDTEDDLVFLDAQLDLLRALADPRQLR